MTTSASFPLRYPREEFFSNNMRNRYESDSSGIEASALLVVQD